MEMVSTSGDCRFCSSIARANGDDPIGSAPVVDHWLIVEVPQPWSRQPFSDSLEFQPLLAQIRQLIRQGVKLKSIVIAPDRHYSQPGYTRIFYYRRPAIHFAEYEKQEYLVPESEVTQWAISILTQITNPSWDRSPLADYRQPPTPIIREILVCTHGNVDAACARFGFPIYKTLRQEYATPSLRVWRCSHFGGHQYAPTLIDLPAGRYWGHLEPQILDSLIGSQGDLNQLRPFYRGWAGFAKFEQIAEREIWLREGWNWFSYPRQGRVLRLGEGPVRQILRALLQSIPLYRLQRWLERSRHDAPWAEVRLDFIDPDQGTSHYEATVKLSGQVMTAVRSTEPMDLIPINQYQVMRLERKKDAAPEKSLSDLPGGSS